MANSLSHHVNTLPNALDMLNLAMLGWG